ncbi:CbaC protein [Halostella salina]|uniref:CbaC protein n=1 Tax=Halostella salina TaxID=1547897 RepID=UPI000EF7A0C9|nr:CbaC protein [Halostella salina]
MKLTRGGVLVLVGISVPIVLELRTFLGFFDIELPLIAVAVLELLFLVGVAVAYDRLNGSRSAGS